MTDILDRRIRYSVTSIPTNKRTRGILQIERPGHRPRLPDARRQRLDPLRRQPRRQPKDAPRGRAGRAADATTAGAGPVSRRRRRRRPLQGLSQGDDCRGGGLSGLVLCVCCSVVPGSFLHGVSGSSKGPPSATACVEGGRALHHFCLVWSVDRSIDRSIQRIGSSRSILAGLSRWVCDQSVVGTWHLALGTLDPGDRSPKPRFFRAMDVRYLVAGG